MKYQAVLFDLDGTLLDTIEDLADSMNSVLERRGFPGHATEAYQQMVGDGMEQLVKRALPSMVLEADRFQAALDEMRQEYRQRWKIKTRPYPGIPQLLDGLVGHDLDLAILSNKPDDFTRVTVDHFLSRWPFRAVVGARPEIPKKPAPAGALGIAAALGIAPAAFVYLGDTDTDMKTARAAGMYAVGALWGFRTAEELRSSGAQALVETPADLLKILGF
jgi:phosphoglycolate phosphatase